MMNSNALNHFFSNDFLGPLLAGFLFSDALSTFLPFLPPPDRAAAIELSWEAAWRKIFRNNLLAADFHTLWELMDYNPYWSLLLLNATALESGNRVVISHIFPHGSPAFLDTTRVEGIIQVTTMPISTVLNLGARFPILEPPGLLSTNHKGSKKELIGNFVDGGYSDNFGALILEKLIDEIHFINCRQVNLQMRDKCISDRAYVPAGGERWIFPL
jgi:hypothetical protein